MDISAVTAYAHLMLGDTSRAGCGLGLPRIAHSQNWALKSANASRRANVSTLGVITGQFDPCLVLGDVRRTGCGCELPRIEYSQNWALESAITPLGPPI